MTLIIGYIDKTGSYIASDSMGSNGYSSGIYKNKKVFKIGDDILAGGCGSYKELQLLEKDFNPPERTVNQSSSDYMYKTFAHELKKFLKGHNTLKDNSGVISNADGEFIFIYDGSIYKWQSDLALLETMLPFDTTGSGEVYAHGIMAALSETDSKLTAEQKLELAIKLTSEYIVSVGGKMMIEDMPHET